MRVIQLISFIAIMVLSSGCVTKTINSDGTVQNNVVDKNKLSDTYVDLAIEYQKHGAPQVALDRVNLAITTLPNNARAYMVRAMIYQQLNRPENAEDDFKRALSLKVGYSEAYVNYAVFLCDQKRYGDANNNFAQALSNPLYFTPEIGYYSRGNCYYKQNDLANANADYLRSLTFRNIPQDSYIALAKLQLDQNNAQLANFYITKFSGSQTPQTMWLHIQILQRMIDEAANGVHSNEFSSYLKTMGQVLVSNYPNSVEAQQYLLKYGTGNLKPASPAANKVVATPPKIQVVTSKSSPKTLAAPSGNGVLTQDGRRYILVVSGDTAYSLSNKYGVSIKSLEAINNLKLNQLKVGMKLYLDPK